MTNYVQFSKKKSILKLTLFIHTWYCYCVYKQCLGWGSLIITYFKSSLIHQRLNWKSEICVCNDSFYNLLTNYIVAGKNSIWIVMGNMKPQDVQRSRIYLLSDIVIHTDKEECWSQWLVHPKFKTDTGCPNKNYHLIFLHRLYLSF
jgi:hypothetical protein